MEKTKYNQIVAACAEAAHEMNRIFCNAHGDNSQPYFKDAPDWQKQSSVNTTINVINGASPEKTHEVWLIEKLNAGWKYGPVKDPDKKEHPCIIPYYQLPPEQKAKDFLFSETVKVMSAALNWK